MNKKYWAILAALLIIVTSFAACTKNYDEDRIITDRESNTHILATDENGQTMQDEDGNIMEIINDNKGKEVTDEDGKIVSQPVTYPDLLEVDGYAETKWLKVKVESGWEQSGKLNIQLKHTKTDSFLNFGVVEGEKQDDIIAQLNKMFDTFKKVDEYEKVDTTTEKVKIGGIEMTKIRTVLTISEDAVVEGENPTQVICYYIHEKDGNTYRFEYSTTPTNEKNVNFEEIISTVEYK